MNCRPPAAFLLAGTALLLALTASRATENPPPAAGAQSQNCPRALLSRPDGSPLGCLEGAAQVRVQERIPGWYRVQVEGWMREAEGAELPAPAGKAALAVSAAGAAGKPAAGAVARLLARPEDLDKALGSLRERHQAERRLIDDRLQEVDRALDKVLFSSDNLTEVTLQRSRLRAEREDLERARADLRRRDLGEAAALFERYQITTAVSDASGFLLLEGIEPGAYNLLVATGAPGEAQAWYLPLTLSPSERRRIDLSALQDHPDPFAPFN